MIVCLVEPVESPNQLGVSSAPSDQVMKKIQACGSQSGEVKGPPTNLVKSACANHLVWGMWMNRWSGWSRKLDDMIRRQKQVTVTNNDFHRFSVTVTVTSHSGPSGPLRSFRQRGDSELRAAPQRRGRAAQPRALPALAHALHVAAAHAEAVGSRAFVTRDHSRSCLMPWWNIQKNSHKKRSIYAVIVTVFWLLPFPGVVTRYVKDCQSRFKISNARKMGTWKTKWQIQYLLNIP